MKVSRSIIWNVCGTAMPLVVGVAVIPAIIKGLGVARFGVLSVIWMMIGYFAVFDLGLSRTLTKVTADRVGTPAEAEIPSLIATAVAIVLLSSITLSAMLVACSKIIAARVLKVPPSMVADVSGAIIWLSIGFPFVLISTVLFGVLEGFHRFAVTSAIRLPLGILMFLVPFVVLPFSNSLSVITAALSLVRILVFVVLVLMTLRIAPKLRDGTTRFRRDQLKPLLTYGGWLTVSNVVGPVLVYFDRLVIAAFLGTAEIAYYTVPYDTLSRLLIFPTAIQGVLFPTFATLRAQSPARVVAVFKKSSEKTLLLMMPALVAVMLFANRGLHIWLGTEFAQRSAAVAKVLIIGVFVNALARAPFVLVQGYGRAKWTAWLHLSELPVYALCLWALIRRNGIEGVALAWTGRVLVDTIALYVMASRLEPGLKDIAVRNAIWIMIVGAATILSGLLVHPAVIRILIVSVVTLCCGFVLLRDVREALFARGAALEISADQAEAEKK